MLRHLMTMWPFMFGPDYDEGGPSYDPPGDDDEIEIADPGEEPPEEEEDDKVTLTKEEVEQLRSQANSSSELKESFEKFASQLQQPVNKESDTPAPQQPDESDEEFEKRISDELFQEGKTTKALKEFLQRNAGPWIGEQQQRLTQANKKLIAMDPDKGPKFKKYQGEIEQFVKGLPAQQQNHPDVWDYAYREVVESRHASDEIEDIVERRVRERMEELGLQSDEKPAAKKQASRKVVSGEGRGGRNPSRTGGSRKVYPTSEDRRMAAEKGVPIEKYMQYFKK